MTIGKKFVIVFAVFFVTVATGVFFFYRMTISQENAAHAEESAAASEELLAQAVGIMDQVQLLSSHIHSANGRESHAHKNDILLPHQTKSSNVDVLHDIKGF